MTFTLPIQCGWQTACQSYDCKSAGNCLTFPVSDGPYTASHKVRTDYNITIAGINIPIVNTIRDFNITASKQYGLPQQLKYWQDSGASGYIECVERPADSPMVTVTEDCIIEKSTLHYLDQRYGVCLYYYQKDELHLNVTSTEEVTIKVATGSQKYYQAQVKTNNFTCTRTEEWRLIIDGTQQVLSSKSTPLSPFGGENGGKSPRDLGKQDTVPFNLFPDYHPDPTTQMVLIFPTPPSEGIPFSPDIVVLGAYEFGYDTPGGEESAQNRLDGGNKDHFYPIWCRNLQIDPFWEAAAARRYQIDWFKSNISSIDSYTPPPVNVDPIPIGTYVKHPIVGEVYQFLTDGVLTTSPNFNSIVDSSLPENIKTHDTTLYYPIGVI